MQIRIDLGKKSGVDEAGQAAGAKQGDGNRKKNHEANEHSLERDDVVVLTEWSWVVLGHGHALAGLAYRAVSSLFTVSKVGAAVHEGLSIVAG